MLFILSIYFFFCMQFCFWFGYLNVALKLLWFFCDFSAPSGENLIYGVWIRVNPNFWPHESPRVEEKRPRIIYFCKNTHAKTLTQFFRLIVFLWHLRQHTNSITMNRWKHKRKLMESSQKISRNKSVLHGLRWPKSRRNRMLRRRDSTTSSCRGNNKHWKDSRNQILLKAEITLLLMEIKERNQLINLSVTAKMTTKLRLWNSLSKILKKRMSMHKRKL